MDTGAVQEPAGPPSGDVYDFVRLQRQIEAGGTLIATFVRLYIYPAVLITQ